MKALSITEKVLVHLAKIRYDMTAETVPKEIAQDGIAESIGISITHVPRAVKELIREGFVEERKRYTEGGKKRKKVYLITPSGVARAREAKEKILSQIVPARINNEMVIDLTIEQLEKKFNRRIDILKLTGAEEFIDLDSIKVYSVTDLSDSPKVESFLDRVDALDRMRMFLESSARTLAIYGARGVGTTSLVKYFVETIEEWNVLWTSLEKYSTVEDINNRISSFAVQLSTSSDRIINSSIGSNTILIFDGYFQVDEPVVELFSDFVERDDGAKIIVTCRDATPSYNRFYRREHVQSEKVEEMVLKGLPENDAMELLGNREIPEDAFRRIYALSNGSPMILRLLRDKDEEALRKNSNFTNEEIRFLLIESASKK